VPCVLKVTFKVNRRRERQARCIRFWNAAEAFFRAVPVKLTRRGHCSEGIAPDSLTACRRCPVRFPPNADPPVPHTNSPNQRTRRRRTKKL